MRCHLPVSVSSTSPHSQCRAGQPRQRHSPTQHFMLAQLCASTIQKGPVQPCSSISCCRSLDSGRSLLFRLQFSCQGLAVVRHLGQLPGYPSLLAPDALDNVQRTYHPGPQREAAYFSQHNITMIIDIRRASRLGYFHSLLAHGVEREK